MVRGEGFIFLRRVVRGAPVGAVGLFVTLGLVGCGLSGRDCCDTLTVFAAASTMELVGEVNAGFVDTMGAAMEDTMGDATIETSYGSTAALARQIRDGAPAEVFISASRGWVEALADAGELAAEPEVLCRNRLVCVTAEGEQGFAKRPRGLLELASSLPRGEKVAIADPGVPAGEYARESLVSAEVYERLRPSLVGQADVRAVLRAVAGGQVLAGFVYATDVRHAAVEVLFEIDARFHRPIEYFVVGTRRAANSPLAERYLQWWRSPMVRRRMEAAGFEVIAGEGSSR